MRHFSRIEYFVMYFRFNMVLNASCVTHVQRGHCGLCNSSGSSTSAWAPKAPLFPLPVIAAAVRSGSRLQQAVLLPAR